MSSSNRDRTEFDYSGYYVLFRFVHDPRGKGIFNCLLQVTGKEYAGVSVGFCQNRMNIGECASENTSDE